ncbi:hypothetical protein BC943DRAFT_314139 [Umbelopsis sp. AD052]|nr:hypothetical protein BC943DRAFT_314139 [Umbelopsis sp. AD052]
MTNLPLTQFDLLMSWPSSETNLHQRSISVYEEFFNPTIQEEMICQPNTPPCLLNTGYMPYSTSEPLLNYLKTEQDHSVPYLENLNGNISYCESDDDSIVSPYAYSPRMSISDDTPLLTPDVFMPMYDIESIMMHYMKNFEETSLQTACETTKENSSHMVPLTRSNLISAQENFLSQLENKQTPVDTQTIKKKTSRSHNKNTLTKCPYEGCQRTFQRTHNLRTHMRIHIHPKPYNCSHCERSFSRRHDLERHVRVHTGDRPYSCPCCARSFARTDALRRHLKMEEACRQSPQVQSLKNKRRYADL